MHIQMFDKRQCWHYNQQGKDSLCNKTTRSIKISILEKLRLTPTSNQNIHSKQIIYLYVKVKTIKLLEDKVGDHLHDLKLGARKDFLNNTYKALNVQ